MTLNVDKHKSELVEAWKEVMDIKNPINWLVNRALFGYCGHTFDLKLISKGDGGLSEMNEDFNNGKVMYGLCRVEIKDRNIEKIVLINWQGEGAPLSQKGTCANHLTTIKHFFPGIHVTINARTEEEVEPEVIEHHVAKSISGDMVRASSTDMDSGDRPSKVGSNYARVNPLEEINSKAKSDFWKKEEEEEEARKRVEKGQRKYVENEVKILRRESLEYFNNEEAKSASPTPSGSTGSAASSPIPRNGASSISPTPNLPNAFNFQTEKDAVLRASAPRKSSTGNLVRDRIKSFDGSAGMVPGSVTNGTGNRNGSSNSNGANSTSPDSISVIRRKEMFESGTTSTSPIPRRNPSEEIKMLQNAQKEKQVPEYRSPSPPKNSKSPSPLPPNQAPTTTKAPASFRIGGSVSSKLAEKVNQNSEISLTNSGTGSITDASSSASHETVVENKSEISTPPPPPQFRNEEPIPYDTSVRSGEIGVYSGTNGPTTIGAVVTKSPEIQPDMGLCAKALYDYQAADETEITFDPGDLITNIETIDEGWWEGRGPNGVVGLFPANYVELLN